MGVTRLMLVSSVNLGKEDMEELLLGKTKLAFPSAKTGEDNTGNFPWG
jgi:hypothetical protein